MKSFVKWMAHEKRLHDLHDDFLATLTRENYLKFRLLYTQSLPNLPPSHHETQQLMTSFPSEFKTNNTIRVQDCIEQLQEGNQERCLCLPYLQE